MKTTIVYLSSVILILCLVTSHVEAGNLDTPYSPTKKEWLELSIFKLIKDRTAPWKQRIGTMVWVVEKDNAVYITLTSANGQDILTSQAEREYVETVKAEVENFLKKYDWSKNLKTFVQFQ